MHLKEEILLVILDSLTIDDRQGSCQDLAPFLACQYLFSEFILVAIVLWIELFLRCFHALIMTFFNGLWDSKLLKLILHLEEFATSDRGTEGASFDDVLQKDDAHVMSARTQMKVSRNVPEGPRSGGAWTHIQVLQLPLQHLRRVRLRLRASSAHVSCPNLIPA